MDRSLVDRLSSGPREYTANCILLLRHVYEIVKRPTSIYITRILQIPLVIVTIPLLGFPRQMPAAIDVIRIKEKMGIKADEGPPKPINPNCVIKAVKVHDTEGWGELEHGFSSIFEIHKNTFK